MSLPSRGAWIEMILSGCAWTPTPVAPLAGSVDRNRGSRGDLSLVLVAPLAGSVDRNNDGLVRIYTLSDVAPLAGSVDRNDTEMLRALYQKRRSPRGERG